MGEESTIAGSVVAPAPASTAQSYTRWTNGPPSDPKFFPIAVWLQDPRNATRFKAAGINLYVALWKGPTGEQLNALRDAGMRVICSQNQAGLAHKDDPTIVGWMHGDEPDNAQSLDRGAKGLRPADPAARKSSSDYQRLKKADPDAARCC